MQRQKYERVGAIFSSSHQIGTDMSPPSAFCKYQYIKNSSQKTSTGLLLEPA